MEIPPQEESRVAGGGSGSPFGPDSTWEEVPPFLKYPWPTNLLLKASKMEARFAALEQRLLKDQEEKHAALVELLVKLHNPEDGGEVSCVHSR